MQAAMLPFRLILYLICLYYRHFLLWDKMFDVILRFFCLFSGIMKGSQGVASLILDKMMQDDFFGKAKNGDDTVALLPGEKRMKSRNFYLLFRLCRSIISFKYVQFYCTFICIFIIFF